MTDLTPEERAHFASFRAHLQRCALAAVRPLARPDICVTIIVRAPEALPREAMIVTGDNLSIVRDAIDYFVEHPDE